MGYKQSRKLNKLFEKFIKTQNKANSIWLSIWNELEKMPIEQKAVSDLQMTCLMHTEPASFIANIKEIISKVEE